MHRRLSLKREVLQELSTADLTAVVGAAPPDITDIKDIAQTAYSCLAYISCNILACVIRQDTRIACVIQ